MGSPVAPRPTDLPPGFELDPELPPGFTLDDPAVATSTPAAPAESEFPTAAFGRGALRGAGESALALINPMSYVRAGQGLVESTLRPSNAANAALTALRDLIAKAQSGPEGIGELVGGGAVSAIPFTGAVKGAGVLERLAKAANISREGRISNIIRAVSGTKEMRPEIAKLESTLDLPLAATHSGLERKIAAQMAEETPRLAAAKAALAGDIPADDILKGLDVPAGTGLGDPGLVSATGRNRARVASYADAAGNIPAEIVQTGKEAAQGAAARGGVYKRTLPGQTISAGAEASDQLAVALRRAIEDMGTPEAEALTRSNEAMHRLMTLSEPLAAETAHRAAKGTISRYAEALGGRVVVPLAAGAGGMAIAGPGGALTGLALAKFLQSPAWHTLAAATKRRLIPILEAGDISRFQQEAMQAIALSRPLTDRLADAERNRTIRQMGAIE